MMQKVVSGYLIAPQESGVVQSPRCDDHRANSSYHAVVVAVVAVVVHRGVPVHSSYMRNKGEQQKEKKNSQESMAH